MKVNTSTLGDKKFAFKTSLPPYQLNCLPLWLNCPINTESVSQSTENVWRLKTWRIEERVNSQWSHPPEGWSANSGTISWFHMNSLRWWWAAKYCAMVQSLLWPIFQVLKMLVAHQHSLRLESGRMSHFLSRKELSIHLQALLFFQALGFDF